MRLIRCFLLACSLWLICGLAWAIPVITTTGTNTSTGAATTVVTVSNNVPAGATVVVCVEEISNNAPGGSIADSQANSYSPIVGVSLNNTQSLGFVRCFYAFNVTALVTPTDTITYTKAGGAGFPGRVSTCFITGLVAGDPLDGTTKNTAFGNSATPSITSGTPGVAGEIFIGWMGNNVSTWTQAAGWAAPPNAPSGALIGGNLINAGTGTETYNPTLALAEPYAAVIVSFKPPAAGAAKRSFGPVVGPLGGF